MITRRTFMHQAATLASVAVAASTGHAQRRYKMGLQLFTIKPNRNQSGAYYADEAVDKDLKVVPSLAESWTISSDAKSYIFKLRPNVTFHDGSPMDAEDVVSTIKRVQSKEMASPFASRLSAIPELVPDAASRRKKLR